MTQAPTPDIDTYQSSGCAVQWVAGFGESGQLLFTQVAATGQIGATVERSLALTERRLGRSHPTLANTLNTSARISIARAWNTVSR